MSDPIVFVSHFAIKEGELDAVRSLAKEAAAQIHAEKPHTLAFLIYLDAEMAEVSIVHVFADEEALARHWEGADERSALAYGLIEPRGWEFFGHPGEAVLDGMREAARSAGVSLSVRPGFLGGFLRPVAR